MILGIAPTSSFRRIQVIARHGERPQTHLPCDQRAAERQYPDRDLRQTRRPELRQRSAPEARRILARHGCGQSGLEPYAAYQSGALDQLHAITPNSCVAQIVTIPTRDQ
jgi:hypothetical protein